MFAPFYFQNLSQDTEFFHHISTAQMVLNMGKCSFCKLHQGMKKALKVLQCNAFRAFQPGTPEGTRTPNIQNRNLTLYPIELRAHLHDA